MNALQRNLSMTWNNGERSWVKLVSLGPALEELMGELKRECVSAGYTLRVKGEKGENEDPLAGIFARLRLD